jgi:multidrug efflux pump subunit AcrA (membrane-fusion protein)
MKLFRDEVAVRKSVHLDGKVQLALPISVRMSAMVCAVVVVALVVFASTATFSRKESIKGWIEYTSGVSEVTGPAGTYLTAVGAAQGDWVRAGQALAWIDGSRNGGTGNTSGMATSGAIITAPISGQVVSAQAHVGQVIGAGVPLFSISPEGATLRARLIAPSRTTGFITPGQEVNLLIDAYPFQRFGGVNGRVSQISGALVSGPQVNAPVPVPEAGYVIDIDIPTQSISAYGKQMPLANGMLLNADIVIDRRSLIEWVLDPLFATGRRQVS